MQEELFQAKVMTEAAQSRLRFFEISIHLFVSYRINGERCSVYRMTLWSECGRDVNRSSYQRPPMKARSTGL